MKVLIIGANGMLGSAAFSVFAARDDIDVIGSVRRPETIEHFPETLRRALVAHVDAEDFESVAALVKAEQPDAILNAVGVIKQREFASDILATVPLNTLFPHRLAQLCADLGARLVHVSTDCVFSGRKGRYAEDDPPDVTDVYGLSKYLGELRTGPAITLRTSIIGPEMTRGASLLSWFLAQAGPVNGFRRAIFSGLPTIELARVIADHVLPNPDLSGLYHVAAEPISKFELLKLIAAAYETGTEINPVDTPEIDRSLDGSRFRTATGYVSPSWPNLIAAMREADRRPQ